MGIFDKIKNAIWGEEETTAAAKSQMPVEVSYVGVDQAPVVVVADLSPASGDPALKNANPTIEQPNYEPARVEEVQNPRVAISEINVATELDRKAAATGQTLNWRTSIVDLMKAAGMEATLEERRELARELGYVGDTGNTAAMNTFLHKALMAKLAENGGAVPPELLD